MIVLHLLKTSTGASWALRQMRELVQMGVEVHVALPKDGKLILDYQKAGVNIHYIEFGIVNIYESSRLLRKIIFDVQPDLIHSHFVLTTLIMRLCLRDIHIPRIFQVPGPLHLENAFFRNLEIGLKQSNDYWVGSCKWTNECYLKSGISYDKVYLSYYGSDIHSFKSYKRGLLKKEMLGLKDSDILVGIVAYMYAPKKYLGQKRGIKGHEDLIDAISILKEKYPNLYCVCIGGAWDNAVKYESSVKEYAQIKANGRIFFTGSIDNVNEVYSDLDCVIHPSHSENLGGAAESLMLGVPTISSDVGGFPDIVIDGETGFLVPSKSPESIAISIEKIINQECDIERITRLGIDRTTELMDIKNTSRSVYDIYKKILNV